MQQFFHEIILKTKGQGFYNFTEKTLSWVNKQKIENGILNINILHILHIILYMLLYIILYFIYLGLILLKYHILHYFYIYKMPSLLSPIGG